jgi:hypothetical protein
MRILRFSLSLMGSTLLMLAFTSIASAQASRTWVSGVGDDANPCSRTAPCKTFAGAISKTAAAGEIDCLDPGGFGAVTITKSITIDCDGTLGSVLVAGTNGIVISDPTPSTPTIAVNLRNLKIMGLGTGLNGLQILSAKQVNLRNMDIQQFTGAGVNVAVSAAINIGMDGVSLIANAIGIQATSSSGNALIDASNLSIWNNATGVRGLTNSLLTFRTSNIGLATAQAVVQTQGGSQINLLNNVLSSNATAVQGVAGSTIRLVGNVFAQNGTAINTNGGAVLSDGTNTNAGNGIVGSPGALPAPVKM